MNQDAGIAQHQVIVVHAAPRVLWCSVDSQAVSAHIFVVHAPHAASPQEGIASWWAALAVGGVPTPGSAACQASS